MGLKEELLKMVDELLQKASRADTDCASDLLTVVREHAAELRGMAKALSDGTSIQGRNILLPDEVKIKARTDALDAKRRALWEEDACIRQAEVMDGPAAAHLSYAPVGSSVADGSYAMLGGDRYQLRNGKLYHAPQDGK